MCVDEEYEIRYPYELRHLESEGILVSPTNYQYGLIGLSEHIGGLFILRIFCVIPRFET